MDWVSMNIIMRTVFFFEVETLEYWIVSKNRFNNTCLKWLCLRTIVATKYHISQKMRLMNIFQKIVKFMSAQQRCNSLLSVLTLTSAHSSHAFFMYAINAGVVEIFHLLEFPHANNLWLLYWNSAVYNCNAGREHPITPAKSIISKLWILPSTRPEV